MIIKVTGAIIYFILFGWWQIPLRYYKRKKTEKMQKEILEHEYNKIKEEQQ